VTLALRDDATAPNRAGPREPKVVSGRLRLHVDIVG